MDKLYRFSPIKSEEQIRKAFSYIALELDKLSKKVIGKSLHIDTLKIFAHYPEEYNFVHKYISKLGQEAPFNSKTSFYVKVQQNIEGFDIKYLGIRIADPYRLHVGCGDYYESKDFENLNKQANINPLMRVFKEDMLEIWHPDFDILGYIVKK